MAIINYRGTDYEVHPDVLNYDDICRLAPQLAGKERFVKWAMKFLSLDKINELHSHSCDTPGPEFCRRLLFEDLKVTLTVDNEEILDQMGDRPFVTVSNHVMGALDGIILIHLLGSRYPDYKVMVNMILNHITAMRPNFIAVDALASDDPAKKAVSVKGIRQAMMQIRQGKPLGFFPAGAVSKLNSHFELRDRPWQPSIIRLIQQFKVPVVPIFFHGSNSAWFNFLGVVSWQLRTLRLPAEVERARGRHYHATVGQPIMPDEIAAHPDIAQLGQFLYDRTYDLRKSGK